DHDVAARPETAGFRTEFRRPVSAARLRWRLAHARWAAAGDTADDADGAGDDVRAIAWGAGGTGWTRFGMGKPAPRRWPAAVVGSGAALRRCHGVWSGAGGSRLAGIAAAHAVDEPGAGRHDPVDPAGGGDLGARSGALVARGWRVPHAGGNRATAGACACPGV